MKSEREFKELLRNNNCPTAEVLASKYDGVILLTSLAKDDPALYDKVKGNNTARRETAEQAANADDQTAAAWRKYFPRQRIQVVGECSVKND